MDQINFWKFQKGVGAQKYLIFLLVMVFYQTEGGGAL